ncbi:MAG: hypothetical protein IID13_00500 [Candidatus Marinimicrobia bacterium]|nr:hypothetical protein [Candidatus Neomarinimicrobiota bacterium]
MPCRWRDAVFTAAGGTKPTESGAGPGNGLPGTPRGASAEPVRRASAQGQGGVLQMSGSHP